MRVKRKIIFLLVLISTILIVDYVFIHLIFPAKKQKMIEKMNWKVKKSLDDLAPQQ